MLNSILFFFAVAIGSFLAVPSGTASAPIANTTLFLSTRCFCSADQVLALRRLVSKFRSQGIEFKVVVLSDSTTDEERAAYEQMLMLNSDIQWDGADQVARKLEIDRTPLALVFDSTGVEVYRGGVLSLRDEPLLEAALEDVVANRSVREPVGRSFGCALRSTDAN